MFFPSVRYIIMLMKHLEIGGNIITLLRLLLLQSAVKVITEVSLISKELLEVYHKC